MDKAHKKSETCNNCYDAQIAQNHSLPNTLWFPGPGDRPDGERLRECLIPAGGKMACKGTEAAEVLPVSADLSMFKRKLFFWNNHYLFIQQLVFNIRRDRSDFDGGPWTTHRAYLFGSKAVYLGMTDPAAQLDAGIPIQETWKSNYDTTFVCES